MRIHLDPSPEQGMGGVPLSAPPVAQNDPRANPAPQPQPVPQQATPAVSDNLLRELAALRAEKATRDQFEQQRAEEARVAREQALIEKGRFEEVIKSRAEALEAEKRRATELDRRFRESEKKRSLSQALARPDLVDHASEDLMKLWADEFETADGPDGGFVVRHKSDGRDPAAIIAERLASPRYAAYVKATNRGGVAVGGNVPGPTEAPQQGGYEAFAAAFRNRMSAYQTTGGMPPRSNGNSN